VSSAGGFPPAAAGDRWVLHVDLDEFIAAVERLRRPELAGRQIIVGGRGDPTERGVVSTASYEARDSGVSSGMPLRTAARRAPGAVFLPVDEAAYRAASERVMGALRGFSERVEVAGWDEAYLEIRSAEPQRVAREIQRAARSASGLACTVGIGRNKLQAKIAAGLGKPAGIKMVTDENWHRLMAERPPDALFGIGRKTARRLAELGITTVGMLAGAGDEQLALAFGPRTGPWLRRLARGEGTSTVHVDPRQPRSIGHETTYQHDLRDADEVRREVARLAAESAREVAQDGRPAERVVVKVRFAPFFTRTHGARLRPPTRDERDIRGAAMASLESFELARPVRLLGVRIELERPGDARTERAVNERRRR
jgi:nucleotidyltransferase/DNA polymerase involved in DNA repair